MGITQHRGELPGDVININAFSETELDLNVGPGLIALQALHGGIGDQHDVILTESHDFAFGLQQSHNFEPFATDLDVFIDWVFG